MAAPTQTHEEEAAEVLEEHADPGRQAAEAVAEAPDPSRVPTEDHVDALEWLLGDDDSELVATKSFELNVGTPEAPKRITWVVRAVDADILRQAQRQSQGNRQQRRAMRGQDQADNGEANLRVVTLATVEPDLALVAQRKGVADPAMIVKHRLGHKPGLIDQMAGEVLLISGYDEEDVQDSLQVKAAGN